MELKKFKDYIESIEQKEFKYGISDPFSWRGVYSEVCFTILEEKMTKEEILNKIDKAFKELFIGYKGGEYRFNEHTSVNFEPEHSAYSDGQYCTNYIAKIEGVKPYKSEEEKLVNLIFA